jgi:hypothetical protein
MSQLFASTPNQSSWAIQVKNEQNLSHITGMRNTNDGFFEITNKINGATGKARLHSGGGWVIASDLKTKKDVEPTSNLLEKILSLKPVHFYYKDQNLEQLPYKLTGFVAQEVEPVLPQVIVGTETKFLDYNGLVPVAIGAIQEMKQYYDEKIANLEMQLEKLKKA